MTTFGAGIGEDSGASGNGASAGLARTAAASDRLPAAGKASGACILIADDLDLNRKLIADMLSLEGHSVDCVADGAEAVRAVSAKHYDLVLMDMMMPEMDGLAATRAIRAMTGAAAAVPIVALTANTFREELESCRAAGMNAALTKPMTVDALIATVVEWTCARRNVPDDDATK